MLLTLLLAGDVMTGRGIDQILPHSVDPALHEPYVQDTRQYVELAERANGRIERPVEPGYIWGEGLDVLGRVKPTLRIINLETSVTTSDDAWPGKGIHYRMHPKNIAVLKAAAIDACVLANNHVLDWGRAGLDETLATLEEAGVETAGAGADRAAATAPAVLEAGEGRKLHLFAYGLRTSGVPADWAATDDASGVAYLPALSDEQFEQVKRQIQRHAAPDDLIVFSVHWGGNWGYDIPADQVRFARRLIDEAGVDIVHGHSSHHSKGLEVYRGRLILYGAGDLLNDYEGIGGHEAFRPDLSLLYLPSIDPATGALRELRVASMQIRRMQLHQAGRDDAEWLRRTLNEQSERFGVRFELDEQGDLIASWGR